MPGWRNDPLYLHGTVARGVSEERRPARVRGKDFALLTGFLDYKAEFYGEAVDEFKPLAEDAEYAKQRPELLYYMGRAFYANASCAKAVAALERYIELQSALGRPLLPASASLEASEAR